ncbi:MFS transporter [Phormidesmis priestleyi]
MLPTRSQPSATGFQALVKNRAFMILWIGQILSQLADKVFFVLLIALLVNYDPPTINGWTMPENSMRSAVMIAATLPAIFFGSAAGIFVDRYDKKTILSGCNTARGIMLLLLPLPFVPRAFVILLAIAFLESILTQFFAPAEQAVIPFVVRRENLLTANALFSTTMIGSLIVGFAIGDPLLKLATNFNADWGREILVGGLYLAAGIVLYLLPLHDTEEKPKEVSVHPWSDFKAGLSYLKQDRLVSNAMLQLMILYSVLAALTVLAINLTDKIGLEKTQFGYVLAAAGVGMVFGAGVLGHWGDRFHHKPLPLIGFLCMAFVLTMFSFTTNLHLSLALSGLFGLGASLVAVPMQTLIQQQTPESMRGKVFGFQNNIVNIALSVPLAVTGPLTDLLKLEKVLWGMSLIIVVVSVWAWRNTQKVLRDVI